MFDLIAGREKHLPSHVGLPIVLSTIAQGAVIAGIAASALLVATEEVPDVPEMLAYVVEAPPPPLPPPPPAPKAPRPAPVKAPEPAVPIDTPPPVPVEEPPTIVDLPEEEGPEFGVPGGVVGGVAGGVVDGIVGGLPEPVPPPPPPPPRAPVRVGGQIETPELLRRVEPFYPPLAVAARLEGVVILEAVIDREGVVSDLKVLRSSGTPVLDREAEKAVRQWRYRPLLLNGRREPFVLTVTLSFNLNSES
jgi:protein TonB